MREIVEAIFYLLRAGCPWRLLPDSFLPWRTVYLWFCTMRDDRVFAWVNRKRQLAKDFERTIQSATALLYAAAILIRRIARYT